MPHRFCPKCMEELNPDVHVCSRCGYNITAGAGADFTLPPGTVLNGNYMVGDYLGKGGFGLTYAGMDLSLNMKVAIKEYYPEGVALRTGHTASLIWNTTERDHLAGCESFIQEARRMVTLDMIANVVQVKGTFYDEQTRTAYIIMNYVEGETIKERLHRDGVLDAKQCLTLFRPIMAALAKAHARGLIHRDISPDNIMIDTKGEVWLLDLGAAREISVGGNMPNVAQTGIIVKPGFSPLEQYTDAGKIGPWTDIYSLCVTIFYCITGKMIPDAPGRASNPRLYFPDLIPPRLSEILRRGLAPLPENRYQTMAEFLNDIDDVLEKWNDTEPDQYHALKQAWHWIRAHKRIAAAAAAAACIIGAAGWALTHRKLTVTQLGTSNANLFSGSSWAEIGDYRYFIAGDGGLYQYNQSEETPDSAQLISSRASHVMLGEECVYYAAPSGDTDAFCQINPDGSGFTNLYASRGTTDYADVQYAKLSDGSEYFYFCQTEAGKGDMQLYRLKLKSKRNGGPERVLDGTILWYNLYQDALYYTEYDKKNQTTRLMKSDLNGGHAEHLDRSTRNFTTGFAENGYDGNGFLFLYALEDKKYIMLDLNGMEIPDSFVDSLHINPDNAVSYENGWFYYTSADDDSVHRTCFDGTDQIIAENHSAASLCCDGSGIWLLEMTESEQRERQYICQAYYALCDAGGEPEENTALIPLGGKAATWGFTLPNNNELERRRADDASVEITGYAGQRLSIEIPASVDGKAVIAIGEYAFAENGLEEIGLPDSVKRIKRNGFYNCERLNFAGLPDGLESIEYGAFMNCAALKSIELPESLKSIGDLAFAQTAVSDVYIPSGIIEIGAGAFAVRSVVGLEKFTVSQDNPLFEAVDGVLYKRGDERELLAFPSGRKDSSFSIPDGTRVIGEYAFAHCSKLTELIIPDSVRLIKENAFFNCGVTEITVSSDCEIENPGKDLVIRQRMT